jgi:hypothetical protein
MTALESKAAVIGEVLRGRLRGGGAADRTDAARSVIGACYGRRPRKWGATVGSYTGAGAPARHRCHSFINSLVAARLKGHVERSNANMGIGSGLAAHDAATEARTA